MLTLGVYLSVWKGMHTMYRKVYMVLSSSRFVLDALCSTL